ncbi:MAG TPA: tetratricopeptide repeat protein [Candidatus Binatia bacterium]|nr:tetratricopeptide repeat protein [Candidatus Binatia bacterium]
MPGIEEVEVAVGASARPIEPPLSAFRDGLSARLLSPRLIPLALALVSFLVFLPALWNGFVEWDDQLNLYENPEYRGLTWPQIRWMFTSILMGHWIPLTWLTFGLDYVLWDMNPAGYHLTSLVIFAANAPVFYFVALRLLRHATGFGESALRLSAIVATLFFAIHPLRAESVGWATERRDVLSGLFFLLTLLMYLKALHAHEKRRGWLLAASVGMFALGLVSKASVMVLPLALVVLDVYPLRRLGGRWREWTRAPARAVWLEKIPFFVLGAAGGAVTYYAQNANMFITPLERYPLSARPAMVFYSLWFYLAKTVVPRGLSPLYELPARVSLIDGQFLLPALAVTAITATVIVLRRRWPAGLAVWAYYAIALGPVIGIVHSGHQLTNDRYSYLPGLGFALVVGAAAGAAVRAAAAGKLRSSLAGALAGLGIVWFCGLAYLSAQQVQIWRDTENLWRYALEADPNCAICRGNLGVLLSNQGHLALARADFERVLALRPDYLKAHHHIGYTYALIGDFPRAIEHFSLFSRRYPNDVDGLNNLGAALLNNKRVPEALEVLRRAMKIKPRHVLSHVNLGYAYADLGQPSEARRMFRQAITLKYDTPQAWFGLARVFFESNETGSARTAWGILGQLDAKLAGRIGPAFLQTW